MGMAELLPLHWTIESSPNGGHCLGPSSVPGDEQVLEEDPAGLPLTSVHLPRSQNAALPPATEGLGVAVLLLNVSRDVAD